MEIDEELKRLSFPNQDDIPNGILSELVVVCNGNAQETLEKTKEVLNKVISCELSFDDSIEDWKVTLPKWFIEACHSELSKEEAEKILANPQGYSILAEIWTLSGFIYWFRPEERSWYWWNGKVKNSNTLVIQLLVYGLPFSWGALDWLLKVSGASEVKAMD